MLSNPLQTTFLSFYELGDGVDYVDKRKLVKLVNNVPYSTNFYYFTVPNIFAITSAAAPLLQRYKPTPRATNAMM